jgi:alpha-glucosidase (family GH31 glycosyl hydrolase)
MDLRDGNAHGVFFLSSNGMDVLLQDQERVTFKIIGGILDMFFFMGPTPEEVSIQYQQLVGTPYMIPYWVYAQLLLTSRDWDSTNADGATQIYKLSNLWSLITDRTIFLLKLCGQISTTWIN